MAGDSGQVIRAVHYLDQSDNLRGGLLSEPQDKDKCSCLQKHKFRGCLESLPPSFMTVTLRQKKTLRKLEPRNRNYILKALLEFWIQYCLNIYFLEFLTMSVNTFSVLLKLVWMWVSLLAKRGGLLFASEFLKTGLLCPKVRYFNWVCLGPRGCIFTRTPEICIRFWATSSRNQSLEKSNRKVTYLKNIIQLTKTRLSAL